MPCFAKIFPQVFELLQDPDFVEGQADGLWAEDLTISMCTSIIISNELYIYVSPHWNINIWQMQTKWNSDLPMDLLILI